METTSVLKKFIHIGNHLLSSGRHLHLLMERITALQQMIDKKNIFLFI